MNNNRLTPATKKLIFGIIGVILLCFASAVAAWLLLKPATAPAGGLPGANNLAAALGNTPTPDPAAAAPAATAATVVPVAPAATPAATAATVPAATAPAATAVPAAPAATVPAATAAFNCNDDASASNAIGQTVQGLGTESCTWVNRWVPETRQVTCPIGFLCTIHGADEQIRLFQGPWSGAAKAGTFRLVTGFAAGDAVQNCCLLLKKEQEWSRSRVPAFEVLNGNGPICAGTASAAPATPAAIVAPPAPVAPAAALATRPVATRTAPATTAASVAKAPATTTVPAAIANNGKKCPTSPAQAASLVGGTAANWTSLPNSDGQGWKFQATKGVALKWPGFGRLDGDGWTLSSASDKKTGSVATLWCMGK